MESVEKYKATQADLDYANMVMGVPKQEVNEKSSSKYAPTSDELAYANMATQSSSTLPEEKPWIQPIGRAAGQVGLGLLGKTTAPLSIMQMIGQGEALGEYSDLEERIPELKRLFPDAPWENFKGLDKDKYMEAVGTATGAFPSQGNIERGLENLTGLKITPQNTFEKMLRLGGESASFRGGNLLEKSSKGLQAAPQIGAKLAEKAVAGVAAPIASQTLQSLGAQEGVADFVSLLGSQGVPVPKKIPIGIKTITKEGGDALRNFEKITKPTMVSEHTKGSVRNVISDNFENKSANIFREAHPIFEELQTNPKYLADRETAMENVANYARRETKKVSSNEVRTEFERLVNTRNKVGFIEDEAERSFLKEYRQLRNSIEKGKELSAIDQLDQFRLTNKNYGRIKESGASIAMNEGKLEANRLMNEATSNVMQRNYKDSNFINNFIPENEKWAAMKNAETANDYFDKITSGNFDLKSARKIFGKNSESQSIARILGKEKFGEFKGAVEDFINQGEKYKLLKTRNMNMGLGLIKNVAIGTVVPKAGVLSELIDLGRYAKQATLPMKARELKYAELPQRQ